MPPEECLLKTLLGPLTISVPAHTTTSWHDLWYDLALILEHKIVSGRIVPLVYLGRINAWITQARAVFEEVSISEREQSILANTLSVIETFYAPNAQSLLNTSHEYDESILACVALLAQVSIPKEVEDAWHDCWRTYISSRDNEYEVPQEQLSTLAEIGGRCGEVGDIIQSCIGIISALYRKRFEIRMRMYQVFCQSRMFDEI
jgi:hypothetical protein